MDPRRKPAAAAAVSRAPEDYSVNPEKISLKRATNVAVYLQRQSVPWKRAAFLSAIYRADKNKTIVLMKVIFRTRNWDASLTMQPVGGFLWIF